MGELNAEESVATQLNQMINARIVGKELVMDPVQVQQPVINKGTLQDLSVGTDEGGFRQCLCIRRDDDKSVAFQIDKKIKEAICGDVYIGFQLRKGKEENNMYVREDIVVIKAVSIQRMKQYALYGCVQEDPWKEIAISQMFNEKSENVASQIECIKDEKHVYSIMKHYGEELFNYAGQLNEKTCKDYFRQIMNGVQTLQSKHVCHRDLSLENILLSPDGTCTIIDFGMALIYPTANLSAIDNILKRVSCQDSSVWKINEMKNTMMICEKKISVPMPPQGTCGKKNYIAPEVLANKDPLDGSKIDNWGLGVILFMLLTGRPPFHKASPLDKWYRMIQQKKLREMLKIWKIDNLSEKSIDLLQNLLCGSNPASRMSPSDILQHSWFQMD